MKTRDWVLSILAGIVGSLLLTFLAATAGTMAGNSNDFTFSEAAIDVINLRVLDRTSLNQEG